MKIFAILVAGDGTFVPAGRSVSGAGHALENARSFMMMSVTVRWATPVKARFGNGAVRQFDCVHDALDCLRYEWPSPRGKRHEKAVEVLGAALACLVPVEDARKAFVSACVESGILIPQTGTRAAKVRKLRQLLARNPHSGAAGCKASG